MLVVTNQIKLYGKKIISDLALRSGSADSNSFSCYPGMSGIVNHFANVETTANLEEMFNNQNDFDADKIQPHFDSEHYDKDLEKEEYEIGPEFDPNTESYADCDYYRRLEDICSEYLEDYIGNVTYNVFNHVGANGVKTYENNHTIQPTLVSLDDNDDITELADLQVDSNPDAWSAYEVHKAIENLPYTIKRLNMLSLYTQIHMLSFIASYVIAKEKNAQARNAGSQMVLKKNAVIAEKVYQYSVPGIVGKKVEVSNKNIHAAEVFDWMEYRCDKWQSYHEDVENFMHYCKVLNIDLVNDDMTKYDGNFANSLIVTTLTPNRQYAVNVFNAINNPEVKKEDSKDLVLETISTFNELVNTNPDVQDVVRHHTAEMQERYLVDGSSIHNLFSMLSGKGSNKAEDYSWQEGLLYCRNELVVLPTRLVGDVNFIVDKFIISELGYCIHLSDDISLNMMPVSAALENAKNINIHHSKEDLAKWLRYSV